MAVIKCLFLSLSIRLSYKIPNTEAMCAASIILLILSFRSMSFLCVLTVASDLFRLTR